MAGFFSRSVLGITAAFSSLGLAAADAAQFLYTITGTTTDDVTGPFAVTGATFPLGSDFKLTYLIDDSLPTAGYAYSGDHSSAAGGGQILDGTRPPVRGKLEIGSYSYTVRTGDFFQPYALDSSGEPVGNTIRELDLGSVDKTLSIGRIDLAAGFNRNETCCGTFFGYSNDEFDRLELRLFSPDFTSSDYRETGTFSLGAGSAGSFITGFSSFDRSGVPFVSYEGAGLAAAQLTVAAVPQAGTWGFMILGAGFVGMSLRSRRASERLATSAPA